MGKIFLSPLVDIIVKNNKIYICDDNIYTIDYDPRIYNVLELLKNGCEESQIYTIIEKELAICLIQELQELKFIKKENNNKFRETIFERQIDYLYSCTEDGNKAQEKIQKKTVCIIGVGGIGTVAIQHLVAAGINSFLLIDGDLVKTDNLNRQFIYKISQINTKKVYAAKEYILSVNPKANIVCIDKFIVSESDLCVLDNDKIDFMICGADKPYNKIQVMVSNYCIKHNIPSIYANVGINIGNWGPIIVPGKDISYKQYLRKLKNKMNKDELAVSAVDRQPLYASFGITNTIVGAYMTFEVIKYLIEINVETGTVFAINFLNYEITKEKINDC